MSQLSEIFSGDSKSGKNNKSFIARLGQLGQKYTDPLALAFGRNYTDKLVDVADFSNKQFSTVVKPFAKVDKTINPIRRFNLIPGLNNVKDWTEAKPADTGAIAAGAYFGGSALLGGGNGSGLFGVGSNGSTGSTAAPTSGGGFNWQRLASNQVGGQQQTQQPPQQADRWIEQVRQQEEERKRQEMVRQQIAALLTQQQMRTPVFRS